VRQNGPADTHRVPPQNVEAEMAVLGALLLDNEALIRVLEHLSPADFYRPAHRIIYTVILDMSERNEVIDLVTLKDRLQRTGKLDEVGGAAYLASLLDGVATSANAAYHSRIVREKSVLRGLAQAATDIVGMAYDGGGGAHVDVDELINEAERRIFEIGERKIQQGFFSVGQVVKDTLKRVEDLYENQSLITGVGTGYHEFDNLTSGLQPSDLIVIAGRPSMGKTSFCLNIAEHVAIENKLPVAVFSLEMSRQQLVQRMLCSEARIDAHKLRTGFLHKSDFPKLAMAASRLSEAPVFIDDTASISVLEIRARSRRLKKDHKDLSLIVIDYLQLIRGRENTENRQQEISDISRSLKALAKELEVPVVALSQLSRACEMRGKDKRPQLSDLRESGAIEQDADLVAFIYRDEVYYPEETNDKGIAEIIVRKQRNGPIGDIKLAFLNQYTRFENLEQHHGR
jgi:replicative DNA helicase